MTSILGISAFYHDSAAALVIDGRIVAAAQEERFSRRKHDQEFPVRAIDYCLEEAGLRPEELDFVGFYEKPLLRFERLLETYLSYAPRGFESFLAAMPVWLKQKLHLPREMRRALKGAYRNRFLFAGHHESHAASAFFPSPFEEAAILTLDGVGEWGTATMGVGRGNKVELHRELRFPHSLGLLYSAFTYYCGFRINHGEYKLMGLAPYGQPRFTDQILGMMDLKEDGSFRLDQSYFNYCQGLTMTSEKFHDLFGGPPRESGSELDERVMDIAASIQKITEEVVLRMVRNLAERTGMSNLCLAGGVALNCVANGRILREGPFEEVWIQPAAGDAGGALGTALLVWHQLLGNERQPSSEDRQLGSLLGVGYDDEEIERFLRSVGASYRRMEDEGELTEHVARALAEGSVVGWFQGRMEFGPRALGNRSIIADARPAEMQSIINLKVKFRESFRPFAPIVLAEHAHDYFEIEPEQESPYMLIVAPVREERRLPIPEALADARGVDKVKQRRSTVASITHVDYSARVQTVDERRNPLLHRLMEAFHEKTGCPVLVNTSFNLGWEPIVRSPEEAYRTFMSSDIDTLCLGNYVLEKPRRQTLHASTESSDRPSAEVVRLLSSPCCGAEITRQGEELVCRQCERAFEVAENIPRLFWPHENFDDPSDVTEIVKAFYEKTPFPNYDDHDSVGSLIEKSRAGLYARRLDETVPYNCDVLEVGCGTGQLTNYLGIGCRQVIGTDLCLNSLRLGEGFRQDCDLERVQFMQMNLFRPVFAPGSFDVVLCNGVLHHTSDPRGGFRALVPLVKPGGYIVIGLYNKWGRFLSSVRRGIFRLSGGRGRWLDPLLRRRTMSEGKRRAWFADQYRHPHESKHTSGEVLRWFEAENLEFVRGVPAMRAEDDGLAGASLFEPQDEGTPLDRVVAQAMSVLSAGQKEGGFFVMIARRPGGDA
jgi:carbamoyltransferase